MTHSAGSGIHIHDSADLWLNDIYLSDNGANYAPLFADNSGLNLGQQGGVISIHGIEIHTERGTGTGVPAVEILQAAAAIDSLVMYGNHSGIDWNGQNHNNYPSKMSNSSFSGTECLKLSNHLELSGTGNTISAACTGTIQLVNSQVNWSGFTDLGLTPTILQLDLNSDLHLHQPVNFDFNQSYPTIASGATIDVAYDINVWVINNNSNGIPGANVGASFSQFESNVQDSTDELGYRPLPDFIGQRWTNTGASSFTTVTVSCGYDSVSNSTTVTLEQDRFVQCVLPLENQPPFLVWSTPESSSVYPSQGGVVFNASTSWDLDDDPLTFSWNSSLDGDILSSCTGTWQPLNGPENGFAFTANGQDTYSCSLSDGIHDITLVICDDKGNCVSETRAIELVNQAPTILLDVSPEMTPWSELVIPRTQHVAFNLTGTFDPEGDVLKCWYDRSYLPATEESSVVDCPMEMWMNLSMLETVPSTFDVVIYASDGLNTPTTYTIPVELFNEVPEPIFTLTRLGNASEDEVTLDGTATIDPEGDTLEIEYWSSLDGQLSWNDTEDGKIWTGHLSRGVHSIEMRVNDVRPEHINSTRVTSLLVDVENSLPRTVISTPLSTQTYTSSELIWFSANGSGDFDAACSTFPIDGDWHCAQAEPFSGSEYLVVVWSSDLDGRLTPEGEDWLIFEERLSAGNHTITLSLDDGIHQPVNITRTVEVLPSAPQLDLLTPIDGDAYSSSFPIQWDARESVDYDGDTFTMSIRSDVLDEPLFTDVSPSQVYTSSLPAGEHTIKITLTDESGMEQISFLSLTIGQSDPVAVLIQPQNLLSVAPGESVLLEEQSTDADGDMEVREWRLWLVTGGYEVVSTLSSDSIQLTPGQHHLSLYVKDSRGASHEVHTNVTVQSSLPKLSNLTFTPDTLIAQEKNTFTVRVMMNDPDGTTQSVRATVVFNVQNWEFNLSDEDGDGYWEGSVEMNPESAGRPNLKVIATDGLGDDAMVDIISITLYVEEAEADSRVAMFVAATSGFVGFLVVIAVIALRRQKKAELAMIDTWDSFGSVSSQAGGQEQSDKLEGGAMDGAKEVLAEDEIVEQPEQSASQISEKTKPVTGIDLDRDDV